MIFLEHNNIDDELRMQALNDIIEQLESISIAIDQYEGSKRAIFEKIIELLKKVCELE